MLINERDTYLIQCTNLFKYLFKILFHQNVSPSNISNRLIYKALHLEI